MKRIDILGPPGSGKTTILMSVMKSKNRKEKWYTDKEFFLLANMLLFKKKKYGFSDIIKTSAFKFLKKKSLLPVCQEQRECFLSESLQKYHGLIDFVNTSFNQDTQAKPDIKVYRSLLFKNELEKVVLLEHVKKQGVVFFEESLMYRYFESVGDNCSVDQHIKRIKENDLPMANACICLMENIDTLLKRLANRNKVTRAHRQMTIDEIELHVKKSIRNTKVAVKVLTKMNVPVLKIGEGDSVHQSVRKIHQFITQFEGK